MKQKVKVLNITGWGRSGSTILGSVLGNCRDFFFGGELRNIWKLSLLDNRLCGCGVTVRECDFWKKVFDNGFSGMNKVNVTEILKKLKFTYYSRLALIKLLPFGEKYFKSYALSIPEIEKLFLSVWEVTHCKVIIDTTKSPLWGYLLSLMDNLDVYSIHLIRDPRGIAYSRKKKMLQPDKEKTIYIERFNSFDSSLKWNTRNLLAEYLWKQNKDKYLMIKYEDFARKPKMTVNTILDFISESGASTPFVSAGEVELSVNHSAWGNPSRFKTGRIELKVDDEWKSKLNSFDKLISTVCTFPLLSRYGYK
ncbi:MAG: hypothetical protein A3I68_04165 [Candidatus Melainabacteria bacterium RIFCSPLOWO2_02_FULL_35_15]|nr:MAG: hypothetical protein A3F80_01675 [Candidatus Melainabacteria bacterium RIFCSPLOWO2_12_FULL_35_11]OGI13165.1 MAG: hypothetical protein A3I68_04165 [Candidatus Melainabacteria bacterium RIFCSPLOWO2_02_FULL_35_15]